MSDMDLRLDVGILKRDVESIKPMFHKIDLAIEKLLELAANVSKMVAVQENRLSTLETTAHDDAQRSGSMYAKIDEVKTMVRGQFVEFEKIIHEKLEAQGNTIDKLKKWSYMAIGAGMAVGYLISIFIK